MHFTPPFFYEPIQVATRSKAWECGRSLAGVSGLNSAEDIDVSLMSVVVM